MSSKVYLNVEYGITSEREDVTEMFNESGCTDVEEFTEKFKDDLLEQARDIANFGWSVSND